MTWVQDHLGEAWSSPVVADYGIQSIPQIMLIGPDGKIIAKDLGGQVIEETVVKALERK